MQTNFTIEQMKDPAIKRSNEVLRSCVHCGFCTATCPTYQVLGDELDSPRGRIYLMKDMLEKGRPADAKTVKHIDRCLSCLSCMSTCPSGVHYMHLVDHAREYIEKTYTRPLPERMLRWILVQVLPHPARFRLAMFGAKFGPEARVSHLPSFSFHTSSEPGRIEKPMSSPTTDVSEVWAFEPISPHHDSIEPVPARNCFGCRSTILRNE